MKQIRNLIILLCLLAGGASTAFGQTTTQVGTYDDGFFVYKLWRTSYPYWSSLDYYSATIDRFYTRSSMTVPATVESSGRTYTVTGIGANAWTNDEVMSLTSLTFEGDVTTWDTPINVEGGMFGFNKLKFKGRSYPFDGDVSNYITCTSLNNLTVYLSDKTESQIAELRTKAPWNQFYNIVYTPIKLNLTTNITLCPQSNFSEDVALYSLDGYDSFEDANYDLSNLTLMNYTSPGVYEVNKYESYVLVARYDKYKVDCNFKYNGYESGMATVNYLDYIEIFDVQSNMTMDLTFTWKSRDLNFIQVDGLESIPFSITGQKPKSGTLTRLLDNVSDVSSGDVLNLTIPATGTHVLDKVVLKAGDTEQAITAPEPENGNYNVNITIPTEDLAYIYVYWKEVETSETFKFLRYGGDDNQTWMMWEDGGVYDYYFNEGYSETIIPKEQLTTDMQMYLDVKPGWTFKVYKNNEDITSQFNNDYNPTEYYLELDKKSATYTVFYEKVGDIIEFADAKVKEICVENWDKNGDGELSYEEAAAVTTLIDSETEQSVFRGLKEAITSFDEFQYFTGLTTVEGYAFYNDSLKSIILPPNITVIDENALRNTTISRIRIPEGVTTIGNSAFYDCKYLEKIDLPESLATIGNHAFAYTAIKSIFIPKNVNSITYGAGANIFTSCNKLANISVDEENQTYDSRNNCSAIIKKGQNSAVLIYGCKNTVIPKGVTNIYSQAFYSAGLTKVIIPETVSTIGAVPFYNNTLDTLVMERREPITFKAYFFRQNSETLPEIANCVLIVPTGTKQAYIEAGWKTLEDGGYFKEVVEEEKTNDGDVNCDGKVTIADVTKLVNIILGKE